MVFLPHRKLKYIHNMEVTPVLIILCFIVEKISSQNYVQPESEFNHHRTIPMKKKTADLYETMCSQDGLFCFNNERLLCADGKLREVMSCSPEEVCTDYIGCVKLPASDIIDEGNHYSSETEGIDHSTKACVSGTLTCIGNFVVGCRNEKWELLYDCSDLNQTCVNNKCGTVTPPPTTPTPDPSSGTTLAVCDDGSKGCSGSNITICYNGEPSVVYDCSDVGLTCYNGTCSEGQCQTTKGYVMSEYTNIRVPNLDDKTCQTYHECNMNVSTTGNISCEQKPCPQGLTFDPCSGFCTPSASCNNPSPCQGGNCASSPQQILPFNNKLSYNCTKNGIYINTVWKACTNGNFNDGGACVISNATCYNGAQDNGACQKAGRKHVAGTNCKFRLCSTNLTYQDIECMDNYYYDDSKKGCVVGQCVNM